MRKDDTIRLRHMLDAAREAVTFARGRTRGDLDNDRQLVLALVKDVEIAGRSGNAGHRAHTPTLAGDTLGTDRRNANRLVHAYFDINLDIVWKTVQGDLPELISLLEPAFLSERDPTPESE